MVLTVKSCKIEPLISAYRDPFKLCFYCPATHVTLQVLQAKTVNKWYRGSHTVISVHRGRQSFFNVQWAGPVVHLLLLKSSRDTHVSFHSGKRDLSILTKKLWGQQKIVIWIERAGGTSMPPTPVTTSSLLSLLMLSLLRMLQLLTRTSTPPTCMISPSSLLLLSRSKNANT